MATDRPGLSEALEECERLIDKLHEGIHTIQTRVTESRRLVTESRDVLGKAEELLRSVPEGLRPAPPAINAAGDHYPAG